MKYFYLNLFVVFMISCNNSGDNLGISNGDTLKRQTEILKPNLDTIINTKDKDSNDSSLAKCYVTFGVPETESDKEWNGDNILFAEIIVRISDNSTFKATQSYRNAPIGAGHAIYLIMAFKPDELKKIKYSDISEIQITLSARKGKGGGMDTHSDICVYRTEAVLQFNSNQILTTGYNEPAGTIIAGSLGNHTRVLKVSKPNFFPRITLIEPIK